MWDPNPRLSMSARKTVQLQVLLRTVTDILECDSGGPAGAVYGFLIVWTGLIATFISISEMVSM
jgi:hypothetical protein